MTCQGNVIVVCPVCGPDSICYAGKVILKTCKRCQEILDS